MRTKLINLLKLLEKAIPPPSHCHHAITYAQHGSNYAGYEDKLAIQVNVDGMFICLFLDEEDFEKDVHVLIADIVKWINADGQTPQLGVALGQYIK
jgi:hypothetical protein